MRIFAGITSVVLGVFMVFTKSGQNILNWCVTTIQSGIHSIGDFFVWIFALLALIFFLFILVNLFMVLNPNFGD
jgi:hypothetical protein